MAEATGADVVAHPDDAVELPVPVTTLVENGGTVPVGTATLSVIHLRGHTPGSIALCYDAAGRLAGEPHLFTGDSLFPGGPGNTQGDAERFSQLMDDLEERVFAPLPDPTWVYPGHGRGHHARHRAAAPRRVAGPGLVAPAGITGPAGLPAGGGPPVAGQR